MTRCLLIASLLLLADCADQSKGAALNACRLKYYLDDQATQSRLVPECMNARSFQMVAACNPARDEGAWDWHVTAFSHDNPACYEATDFEPRVATLLSPM